jgi:hypothetical protein
MLTDTKPDSRPGTLPETHFPGIDVLFKEAKLRERRRRLKILSLILFLLALSGVILGATMSAFGSSPSNSGAVSPSVAKSTLANVMTCRGTSVAQPVNFVISCADANAALTNTHWSNWSSTNATGSTTFALNRCVPYCAASPVTYFPNSSVRLSAPEATKNGRLFSKLVVNYTLDGTTKNFVFSWKGDHDF